MNLVPPICEPEYTNMTYEIVQLSHGSVGSLQREGKPAIISPEPQTSPESAASNHSL